MSATVTELVMPESLRNLWILFQKEEQRMRATFRKELYKELNDSVGKNADAAKLYELFLKDTGDCGVDVRQENQKCGAWFRSALSFFENHKSDEKPKSVARNFNLRSQSQKSVTPRTVKKSIKSPAHQDRSDKPEPVDHVVYPSANTNRKSPHKPLRCTTCEKHFTRKHVLKRHMLIHKERKQFSCKICGKLFVRNDGLRKHTRIHSGEKPYKCTFCGKRFRLSGTLATHIRIHTGEKPFKCLWCGKHFRQPNMLNNHMNTHTKEFHYKCELCQRSFTRKTGLVLHREKIHST